ncbi:MAG: response regulator transcription factor [Legionellaceae bacterium]|nr:response regulator transcription factor [Legionellaceae bacterium]
MRTKLNHHLLLADTDQSIFDYLQPFFISHGYAATHVQNGENAIKETIYGVYDALILDIVLPLKNGLEVIQTVRQHQNLPILVLSRCSKEQDKILCLENGADDYILKPCNPRELMARLRAIMRRLEKIVPEKHPMTYGDIHLDATTHQVRYQGKTIPLTNTEFNILEMFLKSPNQAFSKEELSKYALHKHFSAYDRSIDVHISHLRNKLNDDTTDNPKIQTVRGFGYIFKS